jgi:hypothetical protein
MNSSYRHEDRYRGDLSQFGIGYYPKEIFALQRVHRVLSPWQHTGSGLWDFFRRPFPMSLRPDAIGDACSPGFLGCSACPWDSRPMAVAEKSPRCAEGACFSNLFLFFKPLGAGAWRFLNLLEIKRSLGGTHADFCDAISGKCPEKGHSMIELFLFLRQRASAVQMVDATLREWMLEHWRKPFPYHNDFFRDMISLKVMENGLAMVLTELEKTSARLPISHNDMDRLNEARGQVERDNIDSAFVIIKEVLDHFSSRELNMAWSGLKARREKLKKEKDFHGTQSGEEATNEQNRINWGLIELIDTIMGKTN